MQGGNSVKSKKMWLRWIAITLLVILCINNVGSIALASEIREGGSVLEEKSILEEEFQGEGVTSEESISEDELQKEGAISEEQFQEEETASEEEFQEKENTPEESDIPEEKAFSRIKHPLSNRKREKNLRIPRKPQKDMILIFMSSSTGRRKNSSIMTLPVLQHGRRKERHIMGFCLMI